jgi:hypothetical protein
MITQLTCFGSPFGGGEDLSNYRIFPVSKLLLLFLTTKTRQPVHFSSEQTLMKQSDSNLPTTGSSQFFLKKYKITMIMKPQILQAHESNYPLKQDIF